jgi:hypothetical protein
LVDGGDGGEERRGVSAVRADSTIELMSPVTLAAEAALWTATPNDREALGMYREIIWLAAEENWAEMELLGGVNPAVFFESCEVTYAGSP